MVNTIAKVVFTLASVIGAVSSSAPTWAKDPSLVANVLEGRLEQWRIHKDASGKELASPVAKVVPGDTLEYKVTYTNVSKAAVGNVAVTLPIPNGLVYQAARAGDAAPSQASTDGSNFAPVPLKRKVKAADGKEVEQFVPLAHYRALRWPVGTIDVGKSVNVSARAQVQPFEQTALQNAAPAKN